MYIFLFYNFTLIKLYSHLFKYIHILSPMRLDGRPTQKFLSGFNPDATNW